MPTLPSSHLLLPQACAILLWGWSSEAVNFKPSMGSPSSATISATSSATGHSSEGRYYWPMARGPVGSHGTSPYTSPSNLSSSLAWTWHNPAGRFNDYSNGAILIDDLMNLYVSFASGIRKFSVDGKLLWHFAPDAPYNDIPALWAGALYMTLASGHVVAVDMESGKLRWKSAQACTWKSSTTNKAHAECNCQSIGMDIGAVAVYRGVVVAKAHEPPGGGACRAVGLSARTGEFLWDYAAEHLVWNFYPIIDDDGESFLFQDSTGGAYRVALDGREIWKAGIERQAWRETFTDGGLQLGPNGVAYAVKAAGDNEGPGTVRAFRVADGAFLWESPPMPYPPNSWPAVGRLRESDRLTVMAPVGLCGMAPFGKPMTAEVWGLDAETGELLWTWAAPPWYWGLYRGERERIFHGNSICLPNPNGNPTLDASGNLYIGMLDGFIYRLAPDRESPGVRVPSSFDAQAAFSNGGTSIAPGLMAIASCDTLFVFRD